MTTKPWSSALNSSTKKLRTVACVIGLTAIAAAAFSGTRYYLLEEQVEYTRKLMSAWASVARLGVPGGRTTATLSFDNKSGTASALVSGWNPPEPWGVWSREKKAQLAFELSNYPTFAQFLYLDLTAKAFLSAPGVKAQIVRVEHNGTEVADLKLDRPDGTYKIKLPLSVVSPDGQVKLTLRFPYATPAESVGLPSYAGDLAIGLSSLSVSAFE